MAGLIEMATLSWKTEFDTSKLNLGVQSAQAQIEGLKEKTSGLGSLLSKSVLGGVLGVTGGLSAMAGVGIKGSMDLQDSMSKFQSATGLSAKETENLKGTIQDLFKTNEGSYEDLAKMAEGLHNNMGMSTEDIKKYGQSFLDFSKVTKQNSEDVVGAIDDIGDSWSLNNSDIQPLMDKLIVSNQKYGLSVTDAQGALKNLAPSFQGLGMDINDAMGYLNLFASTGVDASSATSAFTIALKKVKSPEELKKLVSDIQATENPTERAKKAIELFGKQGATMANALKPGTESLGDIQKALDGATGATKKASESYNGSLKVQLDLAKKQMQGLVVDLVEKLTPTIKTFTDYMQTNMPQIKEKVSSAFNVAGKAISLLGDSIKFCTDHSKLLIPVVAGVAGAMTALKVAGIVTTLMDAWNKSTLIATISQKGLNAVIKANPIGMWITIIGLAVMAGVALYQNWDKISEFAKKMWDNLKEIFGNIGKHISDTWTNAKEKTSETWNNIKESTSSTWEDMKIGVQNKFNDIGKHISDIWNKAKENTNTTWGNIKQSIDIHGGGIKGLIGTYMDGYKNVWEVGFTTMNTVTGGKLGDIINSVKTKMKEIHDTIFGWKEKLAEAWDKIWDLKLPHINMPHFTVSGSFSLNPPSIPSFGVNWYDKGGIFNSPTVIGVGEGGRSEFVGALDDLRYLIRDELDRKSTVNNSNEITKETIINNYYTITGDVVTPNVDDFSTQMRAYARLNK